MERIVPVLRGSSLVCECAWAAEPPPPKFEAQTIDSKVAIGYGVAIGDMDGDGKPDILLADKRQIAWYRNGDWKKFVMAADLTAHDDVCIAARDINGDGRVEVAVGANWNPGETSDLGQSGAVYYLIRPQDPTRRWEPRQVAPRAHGTSHGLDQGGGRRSIQLVVVPLHGRGNKNGQGAGARILAYDVPADPHGPWSTHLIDDSMHVTHNFDVVHWDGGAARTSCWALEGIALLRRQGDGWSKQAITSGSKGAASEVRMGKTPGGPFPGSGRALAWQHPGRLHAVRPRRRLAAERVADDLNEGHGLACADFLGLGSDQIVVGWRNPNAHKKVGIRLYVPPDSPGSPGNPT